MAKHDDLLNQGPREAPEPETAEEHSRRRGMKAGGGGIAAGGLALAKVGLLGKFFFWFFAYRGAVDAWHLAGWIGVAVVVAVVAVYLVWRSRRLQAGA
jgi:hypothetical protein